MGGQSMSSPLNPASFSGSRAKLPLLTGEKSRSAGAQGFEPCPRVLETRCSPRSTPLFFSDGPHERALAQAMASAGSRVKNRAQLSIQAPCAA